MRQRGERPSRLDLWSSLPIAALALAPFALGCSYAEELSPAPRPPAPLPAGTISSTIALSSDDLELWVVNPDADSVSVIDTMTRSRKAEILLAPAPPRVDPVTQRFDPLV